MGGREQVGGAEEVGLGGIGSEGVAVLISFSIALSKSLFVSLPSSKAFNVFGLLIGDKFLSITM